jgi:hypothetical protein
VEALQERESYESKPSEISSYLQQVDILHKKGLKAPMWKRIARLEELCKLQEDFQTWKLVLQKRQSIALEESDPGCTPPQMEGFFDLYADVKQRAANLEALQDLEDRIHFERCKGAQTLYETARALQAHELLQDGVSLQSTRAEIKFCELRRIVCRWTGEMLAAQEYGQRILSLIDSAPQLKEDAQLQLLYIKQISNQGLYKAATGDIVAATAAIDRLQQTAAFPQAVFERIHMIALRVAMQQGELETGKSIIETIHKGMQEFDQQLSPERKVAYCFQIAHFLLCFGEAKEALKWVLKLRGLERPGINKALKDFGELLFLLCHYDLKNYSVIREEAKKIKDYLRKKCALSSYEETIVDGLLAAAKVKREDARRALMESMQATLHDLLATDQQKFKANFFPIVSWIAAKLTQRLPIDIERTQGPQFS